MCGRPRWSDGVSHSERNASARAERWLRRFAILVSDRGGPARPGVSERAARRSRTTGPIGKRQRVFAQMLAPQSPSALPTSAPIDGWAHVIACYRGAIDKLAVAFTGVYCTGLTPIRWHLCVLLAKSFGQSVACARKKCYVSGCKTAVSYVTRRDRSGHLPQPCASRYAGAAMSTARGRKDSHDGRVLPGTVGDSCRRCGRRSPREHHSGTGRGWPHGRVGIAARQHRRRLAST
jgi:hypothetical protein